MQFEILEPNYLAGFKAAADAFNASQPGLPPVSTKTFVESRLKELGATYIEQFAPPVQIKDRAMLTNLRAAYAKAPESATMSIEDWVMKTLSTVIAVPAPAPTPQPQPVLAPVPTAAPAVAK